MKNNPLKIFLLGALVFSFVFFLGFTGKAFAQSETTVEEAYAEAGSTTWITVYAPFTGDDNHNGYTIFEYSVDNDEWFLVDGNGVPTPGPSEWRVCTVGGLTASTPYYFRVTHVDPDGVIGPIPQYTDPCTTLPSSPLSADVGPASFKVRDEEIFVSIPISGDSNKNSTGTIEIWDELYFPVSKAGNVLPFNPKRARFRGLIPEADYLIIITIDDDDQTVWREDYNQFLGPITYTGAENLALGKTVTADPGWWLMADPAKLVDGRIQYHNWYDGFAWEKDDVPGVVEKQATVDLGAPIIFSKVVIWHHDSEGIPSDWKVETSMDGEAWDHVFVPTTLTCRTDTQPLNVSMWHPSCAHEAVFSPAVTAQYVRYSFDENTTLNEAMGWAVEIEVFNVDVEIPEPPEIKVKVDIRPGACPNSINLKKKGPAKAAILGAADFDVSRIDPATVALTREGYETSIAPESFNYEDVATPFTGGPCECHDLLEDGNMDLVLKFDTQALIEAFELDILADGETIPLILVGNLAEAEGGTPINGSDCITVKKKEKKKKNK